MFEWAGGAMDALWHNGLAAIPLVLVAAGAARFLPCLPATRHLIWVTVLVWLVGASMLPQAPLNLLDKSDIRNRLDLQHDQAAQIVTAAPESERPQATSKSRKLTSRLAEKKSSGDHLAHHLEHSERSSARSIAPVNRTIPKKSLQNSTPPPRYAARAETNAPDKLARARQTAGPRSHSNKQLDSAAANWTPRDKSPERFDANSTLHPESARSNEPGSAIPLPERPQPEFVPAASAQNAETPALSPSPVTVQPTNLPAKPPASWELWTSAIIEVRDAVSHVPPLPRNVWLGGTALLVVLAGVRVLGFRRRLRDARPAPSEVQTVVDSACKALGLRTVPYIMMVEGRVSPMVWCGVTPKLILPTELWNQLDELGRKAVVFHELAHIRRLDHRTAWIESAIGMLYWWHPLVWWVRGRLHAEAENCCDAWVMTLLPKTRRAYATALLKTREYLSGGGDAVPAMGIGITPGRARLFARRLTMVMTESVRPKLSATGISLVLLVAMCGWVASPARSCPEEEAAAAAKAAKAPCASAKAQAGTPCAKEQPAPSPRAMTTFEKHMAERGPDGMLVAQPVPTPAAVASTVIGVPAQASAVTGVPAQPATPAIAGVVQVAGGDSNRAKRVAELQAELARLERKIETLTEALEDQEDAEENEDEEGHGHDHGDGDEEVHGHVHRQGGHDAPPQTPRAPRAPRAPRPAMPPHASHGAHAPMPPMPPMQPMSPQPGAHGRGPGYASPKPGQSWADVSGEQTTWRTYKLSKGKGEDFFKFMSRSDVPIFVRSNSEGIDIQASPRQHEIFDVFFRIVDPSEERGAGPGMFGHNGPMLAFAQGTPGGCGGCGKACKKNCASCNYATELRAMAEELRAQARADAVERRAQARGEGERVRAQAREEAEQARTRIRRHARDARSQARDQHEMIEGLERQSQVLAEVAQNYREQAERIGQRAKSVNERVEKDAEAAGSADAYRMHVESLERSAEELNRQAEQLQNEVETIEQRAKEVEENAREMEQHAEELDRRAEAVREAVQTLETGVQPTPELVESVIALVNGIEQIIPDGTQQAIEEAVSAMSGNSTITLEEMPAIEMEIEEVPTIELEEMPSIELEEVLGDTPKSDEPDSDDDNK